MPAVKPAATPLTPKSPRPAPHAFRIRRVPAVDGLRGLAVAAVVLYHFFGDLLPGGYLGVDIFFVLSGFLITSLLLRENAVSGRIDLAQFWLRRLRRIVPAAVVVLVTITILSAAIGGDPAVGLPAQFFGTFFFVNNWTQIAGSQSYFADSGVQVFAHYWSLAVEEQFYLFWPLIFIGLGSLTVRARRARWLCISGAVFSLLLMMLLFTPGEDPTRVYYGTDTHAFGLLIGVAVAFTLTSSSGVRDADSWPVDKVSAAYRRLLGIAAPIALVVLVLQLVFMQDTAAVTYRGGLFVASLLTATVLAAVVLNAGPVERLFDTRVMRWLGRVSFSLYLWHWPVMVLAIELLRRVGDGHHPVVAGLISLALSLPLSALSFRYVETPFRRYGYKAVVTRVLSGAPSEEGEARLDTREASGRRRYAVAVTSAAVCAATIAALLTSPGKTQLELDLERLAAEQAQLEKQEKEKADAHAAPGTAAPQYRDMPAGEDITALGDSVMLASAEALSEEFPGIYMDARVSAHYKDVLGTLQQMDEEGTLDPFVVLGMGTNGAARGAYDGLMQDILDVIGPKRVLILVLPYGDRGYMPEAEKEVLDTAQRNPNVYVADWCHAVRDDVSTLRSDLIHPEPPGAVIYAEQIRAALQQWADDDKSVPGVCGV